MVLFSSVELFSSSGGIAGSLIYQTGCATCHGSANSATTVEIKGNNKVKAQGTLHLTAIVKNSTESAAGLNITFLSESNLITPGLAVKPNEGLLLRQNQLVHLGPKDMSFGSSRFEFTVTAPQTPGIYKIIASGNAVNSNGNSNGDQWNKSEEFVITVLDTDEPFLTINNTNLDCGHIESGLNKSVTFEDVITNNSSSKEITIIGMETEGLNGTTLDEFTVTSPNTSLPFAIQPGNSLSISVLFKPNSNLLREAEVRFLTSNAVGTIPPIRIFGNNPATSVQKSSNLNLLSLNQNPVSSLATFSISSLKNEINTTFEIVDVQGNVVFIKNFTDLSNDIYLNWNTSQNGTYFAILKNGNQVLSTLKFQVFK